MSTIAISDHFDYKKILRFTIPMIITYIITSIYGVVDGIFIANVEGNVAFAAVNFAMPLLMIPAAFGLMFGVGGSALSAKLLGEGKEQEAREAFSLVVLFTIVLGIFFVIVGEIIMTPALKIMGADAEMLVLCEKYARVFLITTPLLMCQYSSQTLLAAVGKPKVCLALTIAAGVTNVILDALFIAVFKWGLEGAAAASCIGQLIGGLGAVIYYAKHKENSLYLCKAKIKVYTLLKVASNGMADCLSNLSMSIVNMLFNMQMLKFLGENGVSAYGVIMYTSFIFVGVMIGLAGGTAPLVSYNYGSQNHEELRGLVRKTITLEIVISGLLTIIAEITAKFLASIFVSNDPELLRLCTKAIRLAVLAHTLTGVNIYICSMFGALNNGKIASVISVLRTVVFQTAAIYIIPLVLDPEYMYLSIAIAEVCVLFVSLIIFKKNQKIYHY